MPADLLATVKAKAKREMTNQSDIIRRALMNYLSAAERAAVHAQMGSMEFSTRLEPIKSHADLKAEAVQIVEANSKHDPSFLKKAKIAAKKNQGSKK